MGLILDLDRQVRCGAADLSAVTAIEPVPSRPVYGAPCPWLRAFFAERGVWDAKRAYTQSS